MNRLPSPCSSTPSTASISDVENDHPSGLQDIILTEAVDDGCSLASDVPSLDRSASDSSEASSSNQDIVPPLGPTPRKPRLLRHRNSGLSSYDFPHNNSSCSASQIGASSSCDALDSPPLPLLLSSTINGGSNNGVPAVAVDFLPQFLLPQNMSAPIPKGPVRKTSDFEQVAYKGVEVEYNNNNNDQNCNEPLPADLGIGRFRTREEIVLHFMIELNMLRRDAAVIFFGFVFQWFHSILTNIAYYYHTQLSAAQRTPLKDVAYENLPLLSGAWWMVSEYLVFFMVAIITVSIASILVIRWNPPHGRPLYCIPIIRRMLTALIR